MGVCMITEGVIPIAAGDLVRVVLSCSTGAAVGGGLSMMWGIGSPVPSGGLFIVPAMSNPLLFMVALLAGSVVTGILLVLTKRRLPQDAAGRPGAQTDADPDAQTGADREKDVDLGDISFS